MQDLNHFIRRVGEFEKKSASDMIIYFAYYCLSVQDMEEVNAKDIEKCFLYLSIRPYSNIYGYLSKKSKGKGAVFIKNKAGYVLERNVIIRLQTEIKHEIDIPITDELLSIDILETAPFYIKSMAKQMLQCNECALYDSALVMMRKMAETLIIECFERYGIEDEIKDNNGNFYYLSDLIPKFTASKKWNVSRNLEGYIKKVKKYGDLSAHNRRFLAKKSDMSDFKFELRQVVQEIILIIDYQGWQRG